MWYKAYGRAPYPKNAHSCAWVAWSYGLSDAPPCVKNTYPCIFGKDYDKRHERLIKSI